MGVMVETRHEEFSNEWSYLKEGLTKRYRMYFLGNMSEFGQLPCCFQCSTNTLDEF